MNTRILDEYDALCKREREANAGYHECPCRDCFEVAIGADENGSPSLCHECESAGCFKDGDPAAVHAHQRECQREGAYGCDDPACC